MPAYTDGIPVSELPILEQVDSDDYVPVLDVSTGTLKRAETQQVVPPSVDVVEEGNMKSVTSNAVARDVSAVVTTLQEELGQAVEGLEQEVQGVEQDLTDAVSMLQQNFQAGVDSVYDACESRGSTPASHALDDVVTAIGKFYVPTGTKNISSNGDYDVTEYETAHVAVPNTNTETFTFPEGSTGAQEDLGETNDIRYVDATNVYAEGQLHPALTTQTRSFSADPSPVHGVEGATLYYSFPHGVIGMVGGASAWHPVGIVSISGNTVSVTCWSQSSQVETISVTCIGY